jgi:hypothetical protein
VQDGDGEDNKLLKFAKLIFFHPGVPYFLNVGIIVPISKLFVFQSSKRWGCCANCLKMQQERSDAGKPHGFRFDELN